MVQKVFATTERQHVDRAPVEDARFIVGAKSLREMRVEEVLVGRAFRAVFSVEVAVGIAQALLPGERHEVCNPCEKRFWNWASSALKVENPVD